MGEQHRMRYGFYRRSVTAIRSRFRRPRVHAFGVLAVVLFMCEIGSNRATVSAEESTAGSITSVPLADAVASKTGDGESPGQHPEQTSPSPMFEQVSSGDSGIDFIHGWDLAVLGDHEHERLMVWSGVSIGDYDRDGLSDVFLTRPEGGSALFRNLGGFRFEDVSAAAGINRDDTWTTGASFADIDNDGDLDLYVCAFEDNNLLYENQGDGTFVEKAKSYGLDYNGSSVMGAFSDYDRDGDLDMYLLANFSSARIQSNNVELVRQLSGSPLAESLRDDPFVKDDEGFVIDVKPELRSAMHIVKAGEELILYPNAEADILFRNNGDGTFTDVTEASGIRDVDFGLGVAWWDYNDDNWPDLYVSNDFYGWDRLYRNNKDGTFTDVHGDTFPHAPWFSMGSDLGDLNNDGRIDFMASDMSGTSHFKQKVSMGDMEENKWFLSAAEPRQYMRNAVYLNTGTQRFMEIAQLAGLANTDWSWAIKLADFDNDGWVDVFVSNGMTRDWGNSDALAEVEKRGGPTTPESKLFWLGQPKKADKNVAFKNRGNLKFDNIGKAWGLDSELVSFGAAAGDLDSDGDLDLVVNNFEEPVSVYRNRSKQGHRVLVRLVGGESNRDGIGATVRIETTDGPQVRQLTLSRGFMSADDPVVHFGLGEQSEIDRVEIRWPSGNVQSFENLAADRFYTITEPDGAAPEDATCTAKEPLFRPSREESVIDHREASYDDFERQRLLPRKLSRLGPGLAWGDIDGDGDEDLYIGGASGQSGAIYLNENGLLEAQAGKPGQRNPFASDLGREDMSPLFFDADGDGDLDLYVVSGGVECSPNAEVLRDRLYFNDGSGRFVRAPPQHLPNVRDSGSVAVASDFDRDGDLDLFVGSRSVPGKYPLLPSSRLLVNHEGTFTDQTIRLAPSLRRTGLVTSALWSDVDQDGWLDLLVTHDWGPVKVFGNREGKLTDRTREAGLDKLSGWWNGIAGRDIDGDGDIDYVATNFGLNTPYRASADQPAQVFYGDVRPVPGETQQVCIIEVMVEGNTSYPFRGFSCSSGANPHLSEQFTQFKDFAEATLFDVYDEESLAAARLFEATMLESSVFINDGKGHFDVEPLPRLAQVSPGFGVVLTEVNGDSHADLYIAQNFFGPQPEVGNHNGGLSLLLTGAGDGSFTPMWPDESGLIVPGDATALTTTDLDGDGWPDFVVANNNGPLQAFEHNGNTGNRVLLVRLQGVPGNPTAVGARVTVELDDRATQTAELYAGGGYLSQSSSALVFGLGQSAETARISVVWPDGKTSSESVVPDVQSLIIKQPSG